MATLAPRRRDGTELAPPEEQRSEGRAPRLSRYQTLIATELPELFSAELGDVELELARGGVRDSSIKRYLGAARAWKRYCIDRNEPWWDASTATLLRWLDWRVRNSQSPRSALKLSLAAARFLQRGHCVINQIEALPYTPGARMQLDAFARSATMNRTESKKARPLRLDELDAVVRAIRDDDKTRWGVSVAQGALLAERDAALLLVGWWGALRPDDLARLEEESLHVAPMGLEIHLAASKTTHALLALAARPECPRLCPVEAVRRMNRELERHGWNAWRRSDRPNAFRDHALVFNLITGDHVGRRISMLFKRYGMPRGYSGHSLRAGFATEAAVQGVPDKLVQQHGRWRSAQQHAEYVRAARLWEDTPTVRIATPG